MKAKTIFERCDGSPMTPCRRSWIATAIAIAAAAAAVPPAAAQRFAEGALSGALGFTQPLTAGAPGDVAGYVTIDPSRGAFGPWARAGFRWEGLLARDAHPTASVGIRFRRRSLRVALGISRDVAYGNLGRSDGSPDSPPASPSSIPDSIVIGRGTTSNPVPVTTGTGDSGATSRTVYTSQPVTDFVGAVEWNPGRVSLGVETGWRLGGPNSRRPWYGATLAVPVVPAFALVAGADRRYDRVVSPGRVRLNLGMQWRLAPWARGPRKKSQSGGTDGGDTARRVPPRGRAFAAVRTPDGVRLMWPMPAAASVEVRSDVTGWNALPMQRNADGTWQLDLAAQPGVHRVALRVDGGTWTAPPGLPLGSDGYGAVGLLIVAP